MSIRRADDTPPPDDWLTAYEAAGDDPESGEFSPGSPRTSQPQPGGLPLGCAIAALVFVTSVALVTVAGLLRCLKAITE